MTFKWSKGGSVVIVAAAMLCVGGAAASAYSGYAGIDQAPFAAFVALRRLGLVVAALLSVVVLAAAVLLNRRARRLAPLLVAGAGVVVCLAVCGVTFAFTGPAASAGAGTTGATSVSVLSWNTNQQSVSDVSIDSLVAEYNPDIVVLPEYFGNLAAGFSFASGYNRYYWDGSSATVFTRKSLGSYRVETRGVPAWAGFIARPSMVGSPELIITHLQRYSLSESSLWQKHVHWVAKACSVPNAIAVGDFNAVIANLPSTKLGQCADVASALQEGSEGTWPTVLPPAVGAQVDHIFAGLDWRPTEFKVVTSEDSAGSDHRPIFGVLRHVP